MDYKNGKIYCLRTHQSDEIYIGSTCSPLYKRLYEHKNNYNNWLNGKYKYYTSYELLKKYNDVYIDLLEEYPCENKNQLRKREGELQREMNCVNKNIAGRTCKEYYDDNKYELLKKQKKYNDDNKEYINSRQKIYNAVNREKRIETSRTYREKNRQEINKKQREWNKDNKDKISQQKKQYYNDNKDKINQKITCDCGCIVSKKSIKIHQQTNKHKKLMGSIS